MTSTDATFSLEAAAATRWDVVVIGAGPAGSSAALRTARHGLRVLVIDRGTMPRGKLCGCCLSTAAVGELSRLALAADRGPLARGVPLRRISVAAGGRVAPIDVRGGVTLSRETLDADLLAAAIAAGCHWLPQTTALSIDEQPGPAEPWVGLAVRTSPDSRMARIEGRRVLVATGLGDQVRLAGEASPSRSRTVAPGSRIGIGGVLPATAATLPPGELLMAVAATGYCGIVRLEDGRIDVAAAVDRHELAVMPPAAVVRRIVREACGSGDVAALDGLESVVMRATPALTRSAPLVEGTHRLVMRVGDAAGYVEPFTGEGMGWALAAGRLAAEAVVDRDRHALAPADVAADSYARAHARYFGPRHARCQRVATGLRLPRLVRLAVRAARLAPWAARLAVPAVTGSLTLDHVMDRPPAGAAS
ncbi:MAG: NAD(P)/FAD-dependent oxidoreductase [Planctomycetaceae bacterium]